ncbi:MAG: MMPL family transporter [Pseudomonadota bacterium]
MQQLISRFQHGLFRFRNIIIGFYCIITLLLGLAITKLDMHADFSRLLPLEHEYIKTFLQYRQDFSGANRILIAVVANDGDMFDVDFFRVLEQVTDEVFFIPGVDRSRVYSLFTPNVRYTEVVEEGITGENVIPHGFNFTNSDIQIVKQNVLKAGIVGKLVANDFSSAMVSAELLEVDPDSGQKPDYAVIAKELEQRVRQQFDNDEIDIHIIGYTMVIGEIIKAGKQVLLFFLLTILLTFVLLVLFAQSVKLALIPMGAALMAVIWQIGLLPVMGLSIDPMLLLVPFLIFAIAVSHGVQMLNHYRKEFVEQQAGIPAAKSVLNHLGKPGIVALISDALGFIVIMLIDVEIVQDMAIAACTGIVMIICINLILVPICLSLITLDKKNQLAYQQRQTKWEGYWKIYLTKFKRKIAIQLIGVSVLILLPAFFLANKVAIGDTERGVPELHFDTVYNTDARKIADKFSIGVDIFTIIAEVEKDGCIDGEAMHNIDHFAWNLLNLPVIESIVTLPFIIPQLNSGWNEGSLKWRVIPTNPQLLAQSVAYIPGSAGLFNNDCTAIPVTLFATDHKAVTINTIVNTIEKYNVDHSQTLVNYRLATGNMGVMAATNQVIKSMQFPILLCVFIGVVFFCTIAYRSVKANIILIYPLLLVSVLVYALMYCLDIGLTIYTLPVVALGVGIGVDYGFYLYNAARVCQQDNKTSQSLGLRALACSGMGVLFTSLILTIGVLTWLASPLKFQADMGLLLAFMFIMNMFAAMLLIPALHRLLHIDSNIK